MTGPVVRLRLASDAKVNLVCELGPTPPSISGGWGGWQEVARPRQISMTEWMGPAPLKGTIQLLFDGWMRGRHGVQVTGPMAYLTRAFAPAPNATREPPPFYVIGAPPISPTMQWVCNDLAIDPDSMIVRRADRKMLRANVTLSLLQYVPGDIVISPGAAKRSQSRHGKPGSGSKSTSKTYTVRSGDTLSTIAAKQLGNYRRASDIAKLNGIRVGAVLKAGQRLKLP